MQIKKYLWLFTAAMCAVSVQAQKVVEDFEEYASTDDLAVNWLPSSHAVISISDSVSPNSTGKTSMQVEFSFPSIANATETIKGPVLAEPIAIDAAQYVSYRVKGDAAFKTADFRNLYLYAWDSSGNFGRWGGPVPTTDDWQVFNFRADTIEKPWDSTALPDLSQIVQFAFYQYGSEKTIAEYAATICIDEITVRDTPLTEVSLTTESVVDTFEYASDDALKAAWIGDTNTTLSLSDSVSTGSLGKSSMKAQFNFPSSAWTTDKVDGPALANPVAIGPKQFLSFRIKGDPAFATADYQSLFIYAYDASNNFGRWGGPVPTNSDWQVVNYSATNIAKPWDSTALPDMTKIVRFALFQYGSETAIPAYTASISLDDITIRNTPLAEAAPLKEFVVENFEYASDDELAAVWKGSLNTVVSTSDSVATKSTGTTSMQAQFNFPSLEWSAESVSGPLLTNPVTISPKQYLTFRVKGDPAFVPSDFHSLYLYVYDDDGNFGRWGDAAPVTDDWKIFNFNAATIEKPWNSTALPDLSKIVRFAFTQYGSQAVIDAYTATVFIDDLMVRNAPLVEFPPASAPRVSIDDFESYSDVAALTGLYSPVVSPAATVAAPNLATPAPQGGKALDLAIDFSGGTYPWGAVMSTPVTPFSFPTNAVMTLKFKGDAKLAPVADAGTSFWLSFYDNAGHVMNFITDASPVISSNWVSLQASLKDFGDISSVDIGNLVQWRILVQGWEGTSDTAPLTGNFYVDDIRISVPSITVSGVAPAGLVGATFTNIVLDETNRTVTADLPASGSQGFLTITPAQKLKSVKIVSGKLVIQW